MKRWELRFTGYGGQGVITAGLIFGRAACVHAGFDAVMTEAYGPEITGGFSRADLIIADAAIEYPLVSRPDILIAFSQKAYRTDRPSLRPGGALLAERDLVQLAGDEGAGVRVYRVPAVATADELGRRVVANIVMVGALTELAGMLPAEAVERAIRERFPRGAERLNLEAFRRGRELMSHLLAGPEQLDAAAAAASEETQPA